MTSKPRDFTDHYVQVGSLKMHYLDWGNHGAPQMLLLHGGSQSAHSWDEFSRNMRSDFHVIALDQRGHGDTDWSPRCVYTLRAHLRDIASFVKQVGLKQFVLVGLSMGGTNSYAYTAIHPKEVRRLVIVDVGPEMMKKGSEAIRRFTKVQRLPSFEAFVERSLKYNPLRTEEQIRDRLFYHLREYPDGNWGWKWDHRRFGKQIGRRDPKDLWAYVNRIRTPTLLVRGAKSDNWSARAAERVRAAMPGSTLVTVENAGHTVAGDNPPAFYAAVKGWLQNTGAWPG